MKNQKSRNIFVVFFLVFFFCRLVWDRFPFWTESKCVSSHQLTESHGPWINSKQSFGAQVVSIKARAAKKRVNRMNNSTSDSHRCLTLRRRHTQTLSQNLLTLSQTSDVTVAVYEGAQSWSSPSHVPHLLPQQLRTNMTWCHGSGRQLYHQTVFSCFLNQGNKLDQWHERNKNVIGQSCHE